MHSSTSVREPMYERHGKRALDIVIAAGAISLLWPLMLAVSVAIKLEDRGPVIYRQARVGKNGGPFELLKYRSMPVRTASIESRHAENLPVTRIGRLIRRLSIDELPQLVCILRGDMSVVGPRPAIADQTLLLELRRSSGAFALRPGLTGLAQVNSFDQMSVDEKAAFDGEYARTVSLIRDLGILLRTVTYLRKPPPTY